MFATFHPFPARRPAPRGRPPGSGGQQSPEPPALTPGTQTASLFWFCSQASGGQRSLFLVLQFKGRTDARAAHQLPRPHRPAATPLTSCLNAPPTETSFRAVGTPPARPPPWSSPALEVVERRACGELDSPGSRPVSVEVPGQGHVCSVSRASTRPDGSLVLRGDAQGPRPVSGSGNQGCTSRARSYMAVRLHCRGG